MKKYVLILAAIFALASSASASVLNYTAVDLGNPNAGWTTTITDINNSGMVTGYSMSPYDSSSRGLIWNNGSFTVLGDFGGGTYNGMTLTKAFSVNDSGSVVGSYYSSSLAGFNRAFIWKNGSATDLGVKGPPGLDTGSIAYGINNNNVVVGAGSVNTRGNFYWQNGVSSILPSLSNDNMARAFGINNNNVTVGQSYGSGVITAVMWQNGSVINLGLGGSFSKAVAINDNNQIIGQCDVGSFLWDNGNLRLFPGSTLSAINNSGEIIADGSIYQDGQYYGLNIVNSGALDGLSIAAQAINDNGQIAGIGPNGDTFLLTPTTVPEPASASLVALGVGALALMRRRSQ